MKTTFILIFFLFSLISLTAQESSYFDINRGEKYKGEYENLTTLGFKQKYRDNSYPHIGYQFLFNEEFLKKTYSIFKETFGGMDSETAQWFSPFAHFDLYFDKNFRPYSFKYLLRTQYINQILLIEEKLYAFAMKCMEMDLSPFITIYNDKKFQGGTITISIPLLYMYGKNPEKIRYDTFSF